MITVCWFEIVWQKNINAMSGRKMMVILTTGARSQNFSSQNFCKFVP